ncbi:kinesin-like protein KIF11 [Macrobrachium rosenbergii]|uniref:kinesin-like protein KIF11 n=1 Tax=Macrobrachium rosenbergii TaxID=79674 RepID=UPI0034D7A31A
MASPNTGRKNIRKGQNIKVFVRCRPLNSIEKNSKSYTCVDCTNREVTVKERPLDKFTKTFSFDRVFGPESKQIDVYKAVAKTSVEEVLNGFNCTIFAYGQTGTGKTFTMEGDRTADNTSWDEDPLAGIIPRCVNHLFDELRLQKLEFTMRVSFLELYNEELFDLLSPQDDMSKLRMYEDATRKGSCIIQGLEEVLVRSKANVYEVLEKGSNKRQTAATLMNAHSSRSHTVFTVTLHIKENTVDGDELLKTGKLHLVDLAGSENIGRSGAVDKRAREAGNINMSLLTLGRVITALVEKAPHIPYRESKLTRLLQDALGGRTKTSIIATISPAAINLEETLSTLDYAHRAKNIQNKPEVNQKLNKKELIGEYSQEIERLRLDLMAMREKSGVYLANENYQEMIQTMETQAQEITEKINYIRSLEEGIESKTNELNSSNAKLEDLSAQLEELKKVLKEKTEVLTCTQKLLHQTAVECDEQKYLVATHVKTEGKLLNQGKALVELADTTTDHLDKLHEKLERKKNVENANHEISSDFIQSYTTAVDNMKTKINENLDQQKDTLVSMSSDLGGCVTQCQEQVSAVVSQWDEVCQSHVSLFNEIRSNYVKKVQESQSSTKSFAKLTLQECEDQKTCQKDFELSVFLPSMEKIASLISAQATMVTNLHGTVNAKLTDLSVKLEEFTKQHAQQVAAHEEEMMNLLDTFSGSASACQEKFTSLCKSVDSKVKALEGKSKEMTALLSSVTEITQAIDRDMAEGKSELPSALSDLETKAESAKDKVRDFGCGHKDSYTNHMSNVTSLLSGIGSSVEDHNIKSEENMQRLGEERCGLESVVSHHGNNTTGYLSKLASGVESYKKNAEKMAEKSVKDNSDAVEKAISGLEKDRIKVQKMLESSSSKLEDDLSSLMEKCRHLMADLEKQGETRVEELTSQRIQVLELFSDRMVQDIPTGQTPVRQDYKFSRFLSTTSPHERILQRYRSSSASTMSRIPIPSSQGDTEDEISSPSFDTSGLSLSDSSQVDEDATEVKSLSGSVTDVRSNSGSTTDLRLLSSASKNNKEVFAVPTLPAPMSRENSMVSLSRSSSSTSIPETKDNKENTSVQRGSTKKRGLRPPQNHNIAEKMAGQESQTRSRRVLGMQN